jgi:hypothetical protein
MKQLELFVYTPFILSTMIKKTLVLFSIILALAFSNSEPSYTIAVLKYNGGGDWYANPTSLGNLAQFCNSELSMNINPAISTVDVSSPEIFNYPFLHMTGHGNVVFSTRDSENLRNYLLAGGFLHIDDNYGMDQFIRTELKKVFPELDLVQLPNSHPIYHQKYEFENGIPKIHEHDGKKAEGLGLIHEGRLLIYYSVESDLGDGWEDSEVHNDSSQKRLEAFQMGANMIQFVFGGQVEK